MLMFNRRRVLRASVIVCSQLVFGLGLNGGPVAGAETGSIKGMLTDTQGQASHTGQAVVFLCDAANGMPLAAETRKAIEPGSEVFRPPGGFWHAVTGDRGEFEFADVPAGRYRLVAQAWVGVSGLPRLLPGSRRDEPGVEPSSTIVLLGTAESVEVKPNEATLAYPRRWGDAVLEILTDPEEPHNFIVLSRAAPLGDGVLGPLGWGREFVAGAIGVTRMEDARLTIIGLPPDAEVHVGLLNYDNSPGVGGGSFIAGKEKPVRLPIYASWSNGKDEPPAALADLTRHLEKSELDVQELAGLGAGMGRLEYLQHIWSHGTERVEVEGFGAVRIVDLLAADSYRRLQQHHAQQRARRAKP